MPAGEGIWRGGKGVGKGEVDGTVKVQYASKKKKKKIQYQKGKVKFGENKSALGTPGMPGRENRARLG